MYAKKFVGVRVSHARALHATANWWAGWGVSASMCAIHIKLTDTLFLGKLYSSCFQSKTFSTLDLENILDGSLI